MNRARRNGLVAMRVAMRPSVSPRLEPRTNATFFAVFRWRSWCPLRSLLKV